MIRTLRTVSYRGQHRKPVPPRIASRHAGRFTSFSIIGAAVLELPPKTLTLPEKVLRPRFCLHKVSRLLISQPLLLILVIQAALSLRLVWSNTAYPDEALYLSAGHLELSHWLHGTPVPAFPTYFSGAPVVYPPIGALADTIGGLAGARALSLIFMLIATSCAYGTACRIFGRRSALFTAALFGATGSCQYLGAFATYDAMALTLLAVSTWLGVRAATASKIGGISLLTCSVAALALADAAKYAAALFDPVVIVVIMLAVWRVKGRGAALAVIAFILSGLALAVGVALRAGGHGYWEGITFTTLTRATGTSPPFAVWWLTLGWIGLIIGLAAIGAAVAMQRDHPTAWLGITLASAALLAPAEQARINTITSLFKHVGFGAWFACIVAGLALASFSKAVSPAKAAAATRLAATLTAASFLLGTALAWNQFHSWPDSGKLVTDLQPFLSKTRGPVLIGDNGYFAYYYMRGESAQHQFWSAGFAQYSELLGDATLSSEYEEDRAIRDGYFEIVVLSFHDGTWIDGVTRRYVQDSGRYRLLTILPYKLDHGSYEIWVRDGGPR